ncbi:hypothetical protein ACEWY4_018578 [Coilia grayii]|uniref:Actinodin1 n=1 Tax=Coilia grayii TaxID=363190 RepID=A0ABD1JDK4_9TELE
MREKAEAAASTRRLVRNRRNISWYKQHSDFWNWYKYFTDAGNSDAVQELDRVYLSYLQNKNRAEGRRSYKAYLQHLGEIYKSCADTEDPSKCVASYTSRPKPEPPKPAPLKVCDPYKDPYCLYGLYSPYVAPVSGKAPAPAAVKAPAYVMDPRSGHYYYTPVLESFLSAEQKAELLRICNAEDVECLQYHLRASYGYRPAGGPLPSYAHLGCDPKSDPACLALLMRHGPSGLHLPYGYCNPAIDPYCAYSAALRAAPGGEAQAAASQKRPCNPLFDDKCNPLTAYKLATESEDVKDEPASAALRAAPRAAPAPAAARQDPYAMFRDAAAAAMQRRAPAPHPYRLPAQPRFQMPPRHYQPEPEPQEERHPLGPRGKTKEGYDCFIGYDEECYPLKPAQNEPRSAPHRQTPYQAEAYEPHVKDDGSRNGVVEPDPDCDPEYDANCKLRRYELDAAENGAPQEAHPAYPPRERQEQPDHSDDASQHHQEDAYPEQHPEVPSYNQDPYDPYQSGQEEPYAGYGPQDHGSPNFQDMLRGYGDHFGQDDHRAYTGDYKK